MNNNTRINVEKAIAIKTAQALIDAGYSIIINNGEESIRVGQDIELFKKEFRQTDEERLVVTHPEKANSFVYLVYGNGEDVISDYGVSLEDVIAPLYDENYNFILSIA